MVHKKTRRALGRGLTDLIPVDSEEGGSGNDVVFVDVESIRGNPYQPRVDFADDQIAELAQSIKAQGLLQPIAVRKKTNGYEIISGERRYRAVKHLGQDKIACLVKGRVSDREMLEMALVENIQREDLNDIELARSYERLLVECELSHEKLALRVGKSRSAISNALRLLKLPEEVQKMVRRGELSAGHGRALLALDGPGGQLALAAKAVAGGMSVRELERAGARQRQGMGGTRRGKADTTGQDDPDLLKLQEQLRYHFGTDVKVLKERRGAGRVVVTYYDTNDLARIVDLMLC